MSVISDTVSQEWVRRVNRDLALLKRHRHPSSSFGTADGISPDEGVVELIEASPDAEAIDVVATPEGAEEIIDAPVIPSAPMTTTTMASVTVAWDGYGAGGEAMPPNFSHVAIHRSPEGPEFTPETFTQAGTLRGEGSMTYADQPYGVVTYYRFVMHTIGGEASAPSEATAGVAVLVSTGDVDFTALDIDDGTILAAMAAANGKNQIIHATTTPSAPGNTDGDVWFQRDVGTGIVVGQWEWDGDSWEQRTLASAVIANLDAGKITTGELAAGVRIMAGPENSTHAEMTSTGFKAFIEDPVDLIPNESVRIGTDTNDLFALSDSTGVIKASISDAGYASFAGANVDADPTVCGYPLLGPYGATIFDLTDTPPIYGRDYEAYPLGLLEMYAKGTVAWYGGNSADFDDPIATSQQRGLFELGFDLEPGRQYSFSVSPILFRFTTTGGLAALICHYTTDGSQPTFASPILTRHYSYGVNSSYGSVSISERLINGNTTGQAQIRILVSMMCIASTGNVWPDEYITASIKDLGPVKQNTGILRNTYVTGGAAPTVPVRRTYVITWASTGFGSYRGDGTKRTDTAGDIVQGYNSFNGDGRGVWIFPNTITSAINGAGTTVDKIEAYCYANHWYYNSGGVGKIGVHGHTTVPASSPTVPLAKTVTGWPKPGGKWVLLPSSLYAGFKSGTYKGIGITAPGQGTNLLYYGRFNGSGALLRVTFTK